MLITSQTYLVKHMHSSTAIEETEERVKITLPVERKPLILMLFSATLIVWLVMLVIVLVYLIGGSSSSIVLTAILIFWLLVWLWFGRFLWNRWQYSAADREILFIEREHIILRRPVSILGQTTTYEREHVGEFYISDRHNCPAFDYAYLHVYFGQGLSQEDGELLVSELNSRLHGEESTVESSH